MKLLKQYISKNGLNIDHARLKGLSMGWPTMKLGNNYYLPMWEHIA